MVFFWNFCNNVLNNEICSNFCFFFIYFNDDVIGNVNFKEKFYNYIFIIINVYYNNMICFFSDVIKIDDVMVYYVRIDVDKI